MDPSTLGPSTKGGEPHMRKTAAIVLAATLGLFGTAHARTDKNPNEVTQKGHVACQTDCWYSDHETHWTNEYGFMADHQCTFAHAACTSEDEHIRVDCDLELVLCDDEGA